MLSACMGDNLSVLRIKSQGAVFTTEVSWETWFIRNEMYIITSMALIIPNDTAPDSNACAVFSGFSRESR